MAADDFELLAASLRADARDLDAFLEALAAKLSASLPESTSVEREGFRGRGRVKSISVELADRRYGLERKSAALTCRRANAVRGIVLKNEELSVDEWIDSLAHDLAEVAEQSDRGRIALDRLLRE